MKSDPEYKRFMQRHDIHQEVGDVELVTEAQLNDKRHSVSRAISLIEQKESQIGATNGDRLTKEMFKRLIAKIEVAEIYCPPHLPQTTSCQNPTSLTLNPKLLPMPTKTRQLTHPSPGIQNK